LFKIDDGGILSHMIQTAIVHDDPAVVFRLRAIEHLNRFGWQSACHGFHISKTSLYRWRKIYLASAKKAVVLKKQSTRPHRFRPMLVHPRVAEEIRRLRESHYRLGKEKIKPLLDQYCLVNGLPVISISTIGKVIKRHNLFFQRQSRMYHDPAKITVLRLKPKRLRVKYASRPKELGHLQLDTVVKLSDSLKRYAVSVIDVNSRFVLTLVYPHLTSATALDALLKFKLVYPVKIKSVQTDNGLEFLGVFDQYLAREKIPHWFIYPRCPRINGTIERYNRTLQEEFLDVNLHLWPEPQIFHDKLLEYLLFYNTQRVHKGLGNQTPMDYLIKRGCFSQKCVTHTSN